MEDRAFSYLTPDERSFFLACYQEKRAPNQLADELGVTLNTVYSRKFKVREKLVRIAAQMMMPCEEVAEEVAV